MQYNTPWSAWIDERNKIITIKESPNAKQVFFENREIGMSKITELVSKGYKIGQDLTVFFRTYLRKTAVLPLGLFFKGGDAYVI